MIWIRIIKDKRMGTLVHMIKRGTVKIGEFERFYLYTYKCCNSK